MPLFSFEGKSPRVHPSAFIAPTAVLVGDVTIEERASVWYNAVIRADFQPIAKEHDQIGPAAREAAGEAGETDPRRRGHVLGRVGVGAHLDPFRDGPSVRRDDVDGVTEARREMRPRDVELQRDPRGVAECFEPAAR